MKDTRILTGLDLCLTKVNQIQLFIDRMPQQSEFKDSKSSLSDIEILQNTLHYSEKLLKQLIQRAAAHSLKKE